MFTKDGQKFYWKMGESAVIGFKTRGTVQPDPSRPDRFGRFYGKIGAKHLSKDPVFDGQKAVICFGDDCKWCGLGFKKTYEVWGIDATVDGKECNITMSIAQNNTVAFYMDKIEREGKNPLAMLYKITKTGMKGRDAWLVEPLEVRGPALVHATASPPAKAAMPDLGLTDKEASLIEVTIATMSQVAPNATREEWVTALDKRGFKGRSGDIYDKMIAVAETKV